MSASSSERALPAARHAGEKIHLMMWQRRIRQADLGTKVGLGQSTLSKKLRGEVPITVDELMRIAGVLSVDPGDLLPRLDSNQEPSGYRFAQVRGVITLPLRAVPGGKDAKDPQMGNTPSAGLDKAGDAEGARRGGMGRKGLAGSVPRGRGARGLRRVE